jgi:uncharacterized coiled-coil protein SlyX
MSYLCGVRGYKCPSCKKDERIAELEAQLNEQKEACEGLLIIANRRNAELEAQVDSLQELLDMYGPP